MDAPVIPGIEILSRVGEGGMGVVYSARQADLNRRVAVKVLRPVHVGDPGFVLRFLEEARAAAKISDPNVVAIYDVGRENESCYIVMEYIEGESLDPILKRGRVPIDTAVSYMTQSLKAVSGIHQQGLLHRDIKPSNLMIQRDGRVKLVDFGLAKPTREESSTAAPVGTPKYISPEQARGEAADERTDLYSLGVLFYEMLAGRHPCDATTQNAFLVWHASPDARAVPLRRVAPGVPACVAGVVDRLMEKNPDRRFATAEDALAALEGRARRRVSWRGLVASVAGLIVLSLPFLLRKKNEPPPPRQEAPVESEVEKAARRLQLHLDGTSPLTSDEIRRAVGILEASPDGHDALRAFSDRAGRVEAEAEAAIQAMNLDLAEKQARLLEREFPVAPWPERARDLLVRIAEMRKPPAKLEPEVGKSDPEVEKTEPEPEGVFGAPQTIDLGYVPADGTFTSDGKGLLLLDRASGALVLYSLKERKELERVPLDPDPVRLARRGTTIYVACWSGSVIAVDEASMKVRWNLPIPEGRPSSIAAPEKDERVYASDGERLYAITDQVVESLRHRRGMTRNSEAGSPVHLCAHPDGNRFYVFRLDSSGGDNCARVDRGTDGKLLVRAWFADPGPTLFDPQGQYVLQGGALYDPSGRLKYADLAPKTAYGFHPDLPWAVSISLYDGRPGLFDLHRCAPVSVPDSGRRLSVRWNNSWDPPTYAVVVAPDASKALLICPAPFVKRAGYEPSSRIDILPLRPEHGRLACGILPPDVAEVGYATEIPIPGSATVTLDQSPEGMAFDAAKRILSWTPRLSQVGAHEVHLGLKSGDFQTQVRFRIEARLCLVSGHPWDNPEASGYCEVRVTGDGDYVTVRGIQEAPRVLLYDLKARKFRRIEIGDRVQGVIDSGDDLYIQVPGKILVTSKKTPEEPKTLATWDLGDWALDGLVKVSGAFYFFVKKGDEFRFLKLVPGEAPRELLWENDYFPLWTVDPESERLVAFRYPKVQSYPLGRRDAAPVWSHTPRFAPVPSFRWLDGKRLCAGGDILSAKDGSVLQSFGQVAIEPDPAGEVLAVTSSDEIRIVRDGTYEVLDRVAHKGARWAVPLPRHRLLVIDAGGSFILLPHSFKK